jgi:hypothetical protein
MASCFGSQSLVLFLLAFPAVITAEGSGKERPVMKVVRMLQDMSAELTAALEDDQKVHEMLDCWCKTNDQEKTAAIAAGEQKSAQLEADMDGAIAKIKELETKRKATQEEQYANQKALDEAEELRIKENKAFHAEETDLLEAIDASEYAIETLGKHQYASKYDNGASFSQVKAVQERLRKARVAQLLGASSSGSLKPEQLETLKTFLTAKSNGASFLSIPGFQSYAPQSGQIFGILEQLKKDFSDALKASQEEELKSKTEFEQLKAAKLEQIATAQKIIVECDAQIGALKEKHAILLEEYEDTQYQLGLDREFLADLKKKCAVSDEEFARRVKDRQTEIAAVEDTIKILNTDEMFDVSEQTVNKPTAFLQSRSSSKAQNLRRRQAAEVLKAAAARSTDTTLAPRLILLAASAQLDAFTKVKQSIDKLVKELTEQNAEEIQHRDWCIENLNTNKRDTEKAYDKKANLEAKIADLEKTIKTLTEDIATSTKAIAEMQQQMKTASEVREAENADYQQTINDQRLTQMILIKALERMKEVYVLLQQGRQQPGAAHIATSGTHTDAGNGPAAFKTYEENPAGKRVVALLEEVIAESKQMDDDAMTSEEDAQTAYEEFMKNSNTGITAHQTAITNMSEAKAKATEALILANSDFATTMKEIEDLFNLATDLHKSCDYILNNFDARQAARTAEINALNEAKNILSGMQ